MLGRDMVQWTEACSTYTAKYGCNIWYEGMPLRGIVKELKSSNQILKSCIKSRKATDRGSKRSRKAISTYSVWSTSTQVTPIPIGIKQLVPMPYPFISMHVVQKDTNASLWSPEMVLYCLSICPLMSTLGNFPVFLLQSSLQCLFWFRVDDAIIITPEEVLTLLDPSIQEWLTWMDISASFDLVIWFSLCTQARPLARMGAGCFLIAMT